MKTPYFLIHQDILEKNIKDFQSALDEIWPNSSLAYSVKTNSMPWLLKHLHSNGILAEVVSDEEYDLARLCGYSDLQIIFNGPIKGEKHFREATDNDAIINLDSKQDLDYVSRFAKAEMHVGIRVNIPAGQWHTVQALESGTVILEMKEGAYEPLQDCDVLSL